MLYVGTYGDSKPESYTSYKNRTVKKHIDKLTNQMQQIKSCSLKGEDKQALIKKMNELLKLQP